MADRVGAAGVMRVGEIESGGLEGLLDFREVGFGANFAEANDIRVVFEQDAQDSGFFRIGLWLVGDFAAVDDAIHGQPIFHIVGNEAQVAGVRVAALAGGFGWLIGIGLGEPKF